MWGFLIVNVDNEFKNLECTLIPQVSFALFTTFGWKDLGQRKRVWDRREVRSMGLLLEARKDSRGWGRAEGGCVKVLEGLQGASVQCESLNLDFTLRKGASTSAEWRFCACWVKLQKNKTLLVAPLSLGVDSHSEALSEGWLDGGPCVKSVPGEQT